MQLNVSLPANYRALLSLEEGERIRYCSPFDLDQAGDAYAQGFVAVTDRRLFVLSDGVLQQQFCLQQLQAVTCEPLVGCGMLLVTVHGQERLIARFSMKHLARFSYIAQGAKALMRGESTEVISRETERFCPTCGRILVSSSCPHCHGRRAMLRKTYVICKPYLLKLLAISAFMVLGSLLNLAGPKVQREFIDAHLSTRQGTLADILLFVFVMLGIALASILVTVLKNWWCTSLGARLGMDLRARLYEQIQRLSLSFLDDRKPGELMNRVSGDVNQVRTFMEDVFGNMLNYVFTMVGAGIYLLILNWKLTLMSVVFLPLALAANRIFHKRMHRMFRNQNHKSDKLNSSLQDVIAGMRVVKSFGKEKKEATRFYRAADELARVQKRNETFWAVFFPCLTLIMGLGSYVITYFGGRSVLNGAMTTGQLTQFISYAGILYGPLGWLTQMPRRIVRLTTSMDRIYDVLDEDPTIVDSDQAKPHQIQGDVEFEDVTFGYKSYQPVLSHISFRVKKGEMIGLVGASGTGKSTLINLVMHLYQPDSGTIRIDGVDMEQITKASLHSQIGVVLQETFLFSGTVFQNIQYAKPDATYEEVVRAAKMANAHDFIMKAPDGYNTYVGEHGYNLSGGERQRIAIARAILGDPRILILDEATSNLDTESEFLIQQALERLTAGRTTFAIAHRLSTLRGADRLFVIDKQHIAESGTHNELLMQKGIYYGLVLAQLNMSKTAGHKEDGCRSPSAPSQHAVVGGHV